MKAASTSDVDQASQLSPKVAGRLAGLVESEQRLV